MSSAKRRIALVAPPGENRVALAEYLRSAGFDVHECTELSAPGHFSALVVLRDGDMLVTEVREWIAATRSQRVVVVTSRPTALKELVAAHGERLHVLPAPAFGWEVVDMLRAAAHPRGA